MPEVDFEVAKPRDLSTNLKYVDYLRTKNGCVYQGQVENESGLFEGMGCLEKPEGSVYQGWWKSGKKHGFGREVAPNFTVYVGNFCMGCRCGYGELSHYDGRLYKGTFVNGLKHGRG